jgi:hypothetical protein
MVGDKSFKISSAYTIDSAFAPGVSEPTVLGLNPHSVFNIGKRVILSGEWWTTLI